MRDNFSMRFFSPHLTKADIEMKTCIIRRRQSIPLYVHINTCTVMLS